jgi:hypothetical protein
MRSYYTNRYIDIVGSGGTVSGGCSITDEQLQEMADYIASHIVISGMGDYYDFEGQDGIRATESGHMVYIDNEFVDGGDFS